MDLFEEKHCSQIALSAWSPNGRRQMMSILSELCIMHFLSVCLIYALIISYFPLSYSLLSPDCN